MLVRPGVRTYHTLSFTLLYIVVRFNQSRKVRDIGPGRNAIGDFSICYIQSDYETLDQTLMPVKWTVNRVKDPGGQARNPDRSTSNLLNTSPKHAGVPPS